MYKYDSIEQLRLDYVLTDSRTWPYYPIIMPLCKGRGPATDEECDEITFQVWDVFCNSVGSYKFLNQAIKKAMELNEELLKETS